MIIFGILLGVAAGYWLGCNRDLSKNLPDWHRHT